MGTRIESYSQKRLRMAVAIVTCAALNMSAYGYIRGSPRIYQGEMDIQILWIVKDKERT